MISLKKTMDMNPLGKKRYYTLTITVISMLVAATSCFDSNYDFNNISDEVELTPSFAIPIAHGSLTLDDIFAETDSAGVVRKDDNGLLYIFYTTDLFSYKASDVITIPDQDFLQYTLSPNVPFPVPLPVPIGATYSYIPPNLSGEFSFENGERIDTFHLHSMIMAINVSSTFRHMGILTIYSNNIFVNGKSFRKNIQIGSAAGDFTVTIDSILTDVKLVLDNANPSTTELPLDIELKLTNSGENIRPNDKCSINMSFKDINFASLYGYLGEYDLLVNDGQIDFSLFNSSQKTSLSFNNPQLAIEVKNSFGIPIQFGLDVSAVSSIDNLTTSIYKGENTISSPTMAQPDVFAYDTIRIDSSNSNFGTAMEISPDKINYSATAKINPAGQSGPYNFITDNSTMDLGVSVTIPLDIKANGFALEDTISFDFESEFGTNIDIIDTFRLSIETENEIPLVAILQVYFTDSSYIRLDSMFTDNPTFLDPPDIGVDGKATNPGINTNHIEFSSATLENIKSAKFILVKVSINTPNTGTGYFKFYSDYGIAFRLSAKVDMRINSSKL